MSSDNQFTALRASGAPTFAGFFTNANNITYGVNVQGVDTTGQGCGVYAEAMLHSPGLRKTPDGVRPGIWGVGDHYGVFGASNKLYANGKDHTPQLSTDAVSGIPPDSSGAKGGIGVVGASVNVPGVIGTSDLTDADTSVFIDDIVSTPAGVMGLSRTSIGVVGANVVVPNPNSSLPPQVKALLQTNAGVFGWSASGRGAIFGSATPTIDGFGPTEVNLGSAQVRLLPQAVSAANVRTAPVAAQKAAPSLPRLGQSGDLMAVVVREIGALPETTRLWLCISSGTTRTPATWAEIALSETIPGTR
ncbi:hypothetical protein OKW30_006032 [Paraburkholderia sp. Clong3]|uniref:hypothetical protein n=1 Tax=Paraburkholderia sp. Clong3 TaxID=2991061 RepID=UPI003D1B4C09